ncbi:hypothetical protein NM688_g6933 [Phlebia brevispora]|uniref:Uncharacterized protein n=1 Tax=Phlebia brevispora TaxID=194682 RepID=A0ACC1SAT8_9APHY|nr:hypothetical protein NM688_g6933 [Phlebia brevispora]
MGYNTVNVIARTDLPPALYPSNLSNVPPIQVDDWQICALQDFRTPRHRLRYIRAALLANQTILRAAASILVVVAVKAALPAFSRESRAVNWTSGRRPCPRQDAAYSAEYVRFDIPHTVLTLFRSSTGCKGAAEFGILFVHLLLGTLCTFLYDDLNFPSLSSETQMDNQKLQDPCEVAAYLISPCLQDPAEATVYALEPGPTVNFYTPPGEDVEGSVGATACVCSTVFYSVISACGVCQGDSFVSYVKSPLHNLVY